ncbi:MAG: class I SAM-dependent methyltransferase [Gammaproteobacteria bacterium]
MTLSEKYDQFYASDGERRVLREIAISGWPRNRLEAIVYVPGDGDTILDIGCGDGLLLYQFRNRYRELIGYEYSTDRLNQARRNLSDCNFAGFAGSAESMEGIASESIDRIVSADTIEHIPDVYAAASEMYRVLKPGGSLVINTPNIAFIKKRLLLLIGRFPSTSQPNEGLGSDVLFDGGHLHYFTFRSLSFLLERAGFSVNGRMGYGQFGRIHDFAPTLLSGGAQLVCKKS